jgi:phosphoglycerate dehydrogenase-like enzyme
MIRVWKNTSTIDGFDDGIRFTNLKSEADIVLMGSKQIDINEFSNLKAIFRAGIGRDNVPEKEARNRGVIIRYPSEETTNIIFNETASFTCSLIFKMFYRNTGTIDPWVKESREQLSNKKLLVIGMGEIGTRVARLMNPYLNVSTFDVLQNKNSDLKIMMGNADCITIHIPKSDENISFIDKKKMSWMKDNSIIINTARGAIVNEKALYDEIKNNRIKAAFDVFWNEPYTGILKNFHPEKFYMTPHIASTCDEFIKMCRKGLDGLIQELTKNK